MSNSSALAGLRVIDFGQYLAGPLAAMYLADNGADVIRVDPPSGPRWDHSANAILQRGKRSVVLDLKLAEAVAAARQLIETADVVIENFRPGVMDRLGLAPESFHAVNDQLIWCSMPGFSKKDPRAGLQGWEGIVSAATGLYPPHLLAVEGPPVFSALPLASTFAAMMAAHRIAAALVAKHRFGRGETIEVSLYHAAFQAMGGTCELPVSRVYGDAPLAHFRPMYANLSASDGRLIQVGTPVRGVQALVDRLVPGVDMLKLDNEGVASLRTALEEKFKERTASEWERFTQEEVGVASATILSTEEWLHDEHALQSETVLEVDDPQLGSTVQAGFPVMLTRTKPSLQGPRRPLGADQSEVFAELARRVQPPKSAKVAGKKDSPLSGIKVLDASTLLAGPTTTRILAQYGAEVVKIEKAGVAWGEVDPKTDDVSLLISHRTMNAGKRMMFLDIKQPDASPVLDRLFGWADIVHHNFTMDSVDRLGFAPDQIRRHRPDALISGMSLHSIGGFRERYRGHEELAQAITGVFMRAGGDEEPRPTGILLNDHGSGHLSAFGVLLALLHRYRTGQAQDVNMALSRMATLHQLPFMLAYEGQTWDEPCGTKAVGWGPSDRLYRASDGWFYLACPPSSFREKICSVARLEQAGDVPDAALEEWLENRFASLTTEACVEALSASGIAACRYVDMIEAATQPLAFELRATAVLDHPGLGKGLGIAHPRFGGEDGEDELLVSRRPGMDTLDILDEHGFDPADIVALLKSRAIALGENPVINTSAMPGYWHRPGAIPARASAPTLRRIVQELDSLFD